MRHLHTFTSLLIIVFISINSQAQTKIPIDANPYLEYSETFLWNPSDAKYGIDAEITFFLSYYVVKEKYGDDTLVLVSQNVEIIKGNNIYYEGTTYTRQEVEEKAYEGIRVQEVDFKVTLSNDQRTVTLFFTNVSPEKDGFVRQFGWADVFYGDYHEDRMPLDTSTTEKYKAVIAENKDMVYSSSFKVVSVELLDAKSYNIPRKL